MTDRPGTINPDTYSGRMLVFGGPYSNVQALEALKTIAAQLRILPGNIICTGDIVGYCAQPEESVQLVKNWGIQAIQGNVEQNIVRGGDDCGCNFTEGGRCDLFSRTWFPYAVQTLSAESVNWLSTLPLQLSFRYAGKPVTVLHGAATGIADFVFASTPWPEKEKSFAATEAEVILAGHAGFPLRIGRCQRPESTGTGSMQGSSVCRPTTVPPAYGTCCSTIRMACLRIPFTHSRTTT